MVKTLLLLALSIELSLGAAAQSFTVNLQWANGVPSPPCTVPLTTNLYRSTVAGGQTSPIKTGIIGTTTTDATTSDGGTYFYKVSNVCTSYATPESAKGNEIMLVIPPGKTPGSPPVPTGLNGTSTVLGAQLNWDAVPNVKEYHVFTSTPGRRQWHFEVATTKPNFLDKSAKLSGQSYAWFVSSSNSQGESNPSLVAVVTPK